MFICLADTHYSYSLSTSDIKTDLTPGQGRPEWVFSCYGPGRNAPKQLFEGPQREQSFEELRLRHYEAAAAGNAEQAVQEAQMLYAEAVNQMETVLSDLDGAVKYIQQGANEHPNRIDITEGQTGPSGAAQAPFEQQSQTPAPAFGQPSAPASGLGSGASAFGKPSGFGQPSAFGQPSVPGQASGFGQPSALGQGSSGFGQPSSLGPSAFGKPAFGQSSLGQPSLGQSSFGQPAFGQPSLSQPSLSQPSAPGPGFGNADGVSPFSQISNQNQQSSGGFGQPSGPASNSPFAQVAQQQQQQQQQAAPTGFGQPPAAPQGPAGFGQPSQGPSPFGQTQNPPAPFGQPSTAPNPFGAQAQQPSGFGQPSAAPQGPTGFGQAAAALASAPAPAQTATAGTGPPAIIKVDASTELNPIPPLDGQTVRDPMTKRVSMWKGQPVKYIDGVPCYLHPQDRQTPVRIFFPDGPPEQASLRDAQGKPEEYSPEVVEQYEFFVKNGYFKDGVIPSVPPKTEWVSFDF